MSMVYVEFRLDHPILRATVETAPTVTIEWERNVQSEDGVELLVWVTGDDRDALERGIQADPTIDSIVQSVEVGDRWLYRLSLAESGAEVDLYPIILETGSVIERASVTSEGWDCHFGFPDNDALTQFFDRCRSEGISFEIHRIYEPRERDGEDGDLTEQQRVALEVALENGYFDVPRSAGLDDIGRELGISDTAASERLRRGIKNLLGHSMDRH